MFNLFGNSKPKLTPKEQTREWVNALKKEMRQLERERNRMYNNIKYIHIRMIDFVLLLN